MVNCHLKQANPVTASPVVLRADVVVAFHSALREVAAAHVLKLHLPCFLHSQKKSA